MHFLSGHEMNGLSEKTTILVGIYNQQFQGTIILMVGLTCKGKSWKRSLLVIPGPLKKRCPRSKNVTLISGSVKIPICGDLEVVSRSGLPDLPRLWSSINTKLPTEKRKNKQILVAKDLTSNFFEGNLAFVIFIWLFLECVGFDFVVSPISFPGTGPQRWNSGVFPLFYPQFPLSKVSLKRCWKIIKHEDWLRNPNIPPLEAIIEVDYTSIRWSSVAM